MQQMQQQMNNNPPPGALAPPQSTTPAGGSNPNAGTLPRSQESQRVEQMLRDAGVNPNTVRQAFGNIRDKVANARETITNAVNEVKSTITNKAGDLASQGVDRITQTPWVARQLQRFNIDPKPLNDMATNAVRKAVGYGLDRLQTAAQNSETGQKIMNSPVVRKIALIDAGIQGAMNLGSTELGCDGTNGCVRALQQQGAATASTDDTGGSAGSGAGGGTQALDMYLRAEYSIDAINAAAMDAGLPGWSKEEIAAAVTSVLADPKLMEQVYREAALESSDPGIREDYGGAHVEVEQVSQPVFFQQKVTGLNTLLGIQTTRAPTPVSLFYQPCKTNCPKSNIPVCSFYQVRSYSFDIFLVHTICV